MTDGKILEYTQKQKWLEWLRIEIIKQYNNNIDLTLLCEKNALIVHIYNKHINDKIYNQDFTIAFLNENYYKIVREILSINQKQQKQQNKIALQEQIRINNINYLKIKFYTPITFLILTIFLSILFIPIYYI